MSEDIKKQVEGAAFYMPPNALPLLWLPSWRRKWHCHFSGFLLAEEAWWTGNM